jgi:ribosomal protein S18 acetylase RimI-like enzyme
LVKEQKILNNTDYKIVTITNENVDDYDLFCYKSKKKSLGYQKKLAWFKERYKEGLRIKLLMVREKKGFTSRGFIEYAPGEYAWRAIEAKGYMVIHCLWVVGRNKGKGYGSKLIKECLNDAKGMDGVAVVTSDKTWLPGKGVFIKNGFKKVGTALSDFELYSYPLTADAPSPRFKLSNSSETGETKGFVILKSDQCPYTQVSMREFEEYANEKGMSIEVRTLSNSTEAQMSPHPYGTYCVTLDGEILSYRPIGRKSLRDML